MKLQHLLMAALMGGVMMIPVWQWKYNDYCRSVDI